MLISRTTTVNHIIINIVIPFDKLWHQYERLIKPSGAIVLFGKNPFTAKLILSNEKLFKYELIWEKTRAGNNMQVCKQPSAIHDNILLFYICNLIKQN